LTDLRIIITNDDGVDAPGLAALARALADLGAVEVVAPAEPRSGCALASSFHAPLSVRELTLDGGLPARAVGGYPVDCVRLALCDGDGRPPALVASGINAGLNLYRHLPYSGTTGAAAEAALWGVPALAVSTGFLQGTDTWGRPADEDYHRAAAVAREVAADILADGLRPGHFLNLNVPGAVHGELRGLRRTRSYPFTIYARYAAEHPAGLLLRGRGHNPTPPPPDSDLGAVAAGYASLTDCPAAPDVDDGPFAPYWIRHDHPSLQTRDDDD